MQLRWLGTAGFQLRSDGGIVVLIDPYLSRPPAARPPSPVNLTDLSRADAIMVTHGHFDHASDVPVLANRLDAPVYASATVCRTLMQHGLPRSHSVPLSPTEPVKVGDLQMYPLAARHVRFDPMLVLRTLPRLLICLGSLHHLLLDWPAGQVLGFHIITPTLRLVHFGSAGWVEGTLEGIRPDVALIPVQGRSDIVQVAVRMARLLQPRLLIPHHWDDFCPPVSQLIPLTPLARSLSRCLPTAKFHVPGIGQWWWIA